ESGDDVEEYDDDDGDSDSGEPRTRAQQRADARRARAARQPTITVPEGFTMATTKARLLAMGFDLLVLLGIFLAVYQWGLSLVDKKFPGERHHLSELVTQENNAIKKVNDDKKKVSAAEDA